MGIFDELNRRNVFRVAVAYLIVAWLVAQVADLVLDNIGAPEWVMPALFLMLGLGFVAAFVISWAYEITPEGIKRERDVVRDESITQLTAKKLDYITIAAVVGVAVMFLLQQNDSSQAIVDTPAAASSQKGGEMPMPTASGDQSIAVLPFANRSNNEEDLFFTDGIHDDLLTQLAKIKDLKVTSRTSVMQYRESDKQIPQIARELGVSTILEGGVQRAGQRIRINAQLIDVVTDEHLWAETFDREMTIDNLFDIQSEITRQIVTAVRGELTDADERSLVTMPTNSLEAYEAFSHARALLYGAGYNAEKYERALSFAERAIEFDPKFAKGYLLLANVHAQLFWIGVDASPQRRQAAYAAAEKAAELMPEDSPELMAVQGEFLYRFDQDYSASLELFRKAHAAMPGNAIAAAQVAYALRRLGLWDEAIDTLLQVLESDPANTGIAYDIIDNLSQSQQWSRLQLFMSETGERFGDDPAVTSLLAFAHLRGRGDIIAARERLDQILPSREEYYFSMATELPWYERDYAGVVAVWERPEIRGFESLAGYTANRELYLGQAYQQLGDHGRAIRFIQQGVEQFSDLDRDGPRVIFAYDLGTLSLLLALSGEFERAVATGEEALDLMSLEDDHLAGPQIAIVVSKVFALSGERDRALELLVKIIDIPAGPTRWELYLDPRWDFFRDDERFNDLIRPHDIEQSKND